MNKGSARDIQKQGIVVFERWPGINDRFILANLESHDAAGALRAEGWGVGAAAAAGGVAGCVLGLARTLPFYMVGRMGVSSQFAAGGLTRGCLRNSVEPCSRRGTSGICCC